MSTRFTVAFVTLASIVATVAAAEEAGPMDLEGVVGPRVRPPSSVPPVSWLVTGRCASSCSTARYRQLTASSIPFDAEVGLAVRGALRGDPLGPAPDTGVFAAATAPEGLVR